MSSRPWFHFGWFCLVVTGGLLLHGGLRFAERRRDAKAAAMDTSRGQAREGAMAVRGLLAGAEGAAQGLASDLGSGALVQAGLPARLEDAMTGMQGHAARVGVLFAGPHPASPYVEGLDQGFRHFTYDPQGGFASQTWFRKALLSASWGEPHREAATDSFLLDFTAPFQLPGAKAPSGVVRVEFDMAAIQNVVGDLAPGSYGYGFLLSGRGVYLADPQESKVRNQVTFEEDAREARDPGMAALGAAVRSHRPGFSETVRGVSGQPSWMVLEPVPETGWSLGTIAMQDGLSLVPPGERRELARLVSLAVATGLAALFMLLGLWNPGPGKVWAFSLAGSVLVAAGTCLLWHFAYTRHPESREREVQVMSQASRKAFLHRRAARGEGHPEDSETLIPTGVFIQQVEISQDTRLNVSGQVWLKYPAGYPADGRGVAFPEAVTSEVGQGFSRQEGDTLVQVYPFHGAFKMDRDSIVTYPFDRASIRLRVLPRLPYAGAVLVPDLEAYASLVPTSMPGLDKGLSLPGWALEQSRFSFLSHPYEMNLGLAGPTGRRDVPELLFTLTMRRNFLNPFIATFLPIAVVAGLLFASVLTMTRNPDLLTLVGYNASGMIRSVTSLFFPVVVSQISLRSHILTQGLLIVEYYYFAIYFLILLAAVSALAFAHGASSGLAREDNRLAKLLYWPFLTGTFFVITLLYLL